MEAPHFEVRLARKTVTALDIVSLELQSLNGQPLPAFSAGAHIDVVIDDGLIRQYSLCNAPSEQHRYVLGVLRDPDSRGGSSAVHERLHEGQTLRISAPRNHFPLVEDKPALLLAGGIGVTPILCMAEALHAQGGTFEMHYASRSAERAAFTERLTHAPYHAHVHLHFDDGAPEQRLDLAAVLAAQSADTHLYVCGPAGFIDFVTRSAEQAGWPEQRVHFEHFAAKAIDTSADGSFEVKIASTGEVVPVAADQSITDALEAAGIEVPVSCQQGICGACATRVLEGQVEHRDQVLNDKERHEEGWFTPCCSRAQSKSLLLDL